jgi:hypothetical protein
MTSPLIGICGDNVRTLFAIRNRTELGFAYPGAITPILADTLAKIHHNLAGFRVTQDSEVTVMQALQEIGWIGR